MDSQTGPVPPELVNPTPAASPLGEMARRHSQLGLCLLLFVGLSLLSSALASSDVVYFALTDGLGLPDWIMEALYYLLVYGISLPLVALVMSRIPKDAPPARAELGLSSLDIALLLLVSLPLTELGAYLGDLLAGFLSSGLASDPLQAQSEMPLALDLLVTLVAAPVMEELLFRRCFLERSARWGEAGAILFSALCFALFHENVYQFFYTFTTGALLAYVYLRTRNVGVTMLMHSVQNFLGGSVMDICLAFMSATEVDIVNETGTEGLWGQLLAGGLTPAGTGYLVWALAMPLLTLAGLVLVLAWLRGNLKVQRMPEEVPLLGDGGGEGKDGAVARLLNLGMGCFVLLEALIACSHLL